ncbi:MAG: hypothetical protein M1497_15685 [Nitrospirae bacterium]|nr:hypothetical protein [Nitrospirota bacterium]
MKRIAAFVVALVFILGFAAAGFSADKCGACHKGDKALDKIVAKKNIKSVADFVKAVKEGPTAKMHAKFSDDDLKAAAGELKLAQ